nr:hypothetical protein [Rickettsia endosymbiont of Culicoides newsteadi]
MQLSLNNNNISDNLVNQIYDIIGVNKNTSNLAPSVTSIEFKHNKNQIGYKEANAIAKVLDNNKTVTTIYSENQIGDAGAKTIAQALQNNSTATTLALRCCQIGDEGAIALAQALQQNNKTLETLDLWGNNIGNKGPKALVQALQNNKTLKKLDLRWNWVSDELLKDINKLLEINQLQAEELSKKIEQGVDSVQEKLVSEDNIKAEEKQKNLEIIQQSKCETLELVMVLKLQKMQQSQQIEHSSGTKIISNHNLKLLLSNVSNSAELYEALESLLIGDIEPLSEGV